MRCYCINAVGHTQGAKRISSSPLPLSVSLPLPPQFDWIQQSVTTVTLGDFSFPVTVLCMLALGYLLNLSRKWTVICSLLPMQGRDKCLILVKICQTGTSTLAYCSGLLTPLLVLRAQFCTVTESPSHCCLPVNFLLPLLFSQLQQKSFSDFFFLFLLVYIYVLIFQGNDKHC